VSPSLVAAPVLIPLFAGALSAPLGRRPGAQRAVAIVASALLILVGARLVDATRHQEVLVLALGGWSPHVGIVWVVDALAALMLVTSAIVACASCVYAHASRARAWFHPLAMLLMVGVDGSIVTGDLFNLFVFFEIMLLASFALIAASARPRGLRHVHAYVVVSLSASALLLAGVGAIYGTMGTVDLAELAVRARVHATGATFRAAAALVLVVFALKAALWPLFVWLPDAYPEASPAVNGLFAGLLTKVGVYAMFRVLSLAGDAAPTGLLVVVAALTMLVGVIGALGRRTIRGVLSFHVVSQVGYMIFGLALASPLALAAGLFHVVHNMIAKTALVLVGGLVERVGGSGRLGEVRGLVRSHPWIAVGFFVPALSLAGLPPLSGFWGKLGLVVAGFREGAVVTTIVSLVVGLLTLASMLKIWNAVFWGDAVGERAPERGRDRGALGAVLSLGALTVVLGLAAGPVLAHLGRTAESLLATTPYLTAVLGARAAKGAHRGAWSSPGRRRAEGSLRRPSLSERARAHP
jgi:multicomponent Na+:H+ antiporter subunit D